MLKMPYVAAVGLGILALLVGSCQSDDQAGNLNPTPQDSGLVASLPSLSELAGTPAPDTSALTLFDPDRISLGRKLYGIHCAECHGSNLEGEAGWQAPNEDNSFRAPPHDASGHTWHHSDRVLIEAIQLGGARLPENIGGTSNMPAFDQALTEKQIKSVLSYIKSSWPVEIRAIQFDMTARESNQ